MRGTLYFWLYRLLCLSWTHVGLKASQDCVDSAALCSAVTFTGDPDALLHLSPPMCLIMITLQGLHALLAEEGPCSTVTLPKRFFERWDVPLLFMMCQYQLDSQCPLSWDDTLVGFMSNFPELYRLKNTRNEQLGETAITVECVEAPGFRAVAERLRRIGTK